MLYAINWIIVFIMLAFKSCNICNNWLDSQHRTIGQS